MTTKPPQAGDPAPDFELTDLNGHLRRLPDAFNDGHNLLLVFLRHLG